MSEPSAQHERASEPSAQADERRPVLRALVSVYDKAGLTELAEGLHKLGVEIVSTGSTAQRIADSGVNVVEPVGGLASFYTDWNAASPGNKIKYRYRWTCRLNTIINELDARGLAAGPREKYALMGISMGGNAAMIYGAYHRKRISHIFSMSGFLNPSAPTMREAVRLALIDAGMAAGVGPFNADSMWGLPWDKRWVNNDAVVQLPRMRGMHIRVGAASGVWGRYNTDAVGSIKGTPLEVFSLAQTRTFEVAAAISGIRVTTDYPAVGTHQWGYWQDMVFAAKRSGWFRD